MVAKETLRQLSRLFSSPAPSTSTSSSPSNPFPGFTLPSDVLSLLDDCIRTFASLPAPPSGGGTSAAQSESDRERTRWREGLLEIWTQVEPLPGTERDLHNIGRVSAFLVLLDKLSADVGEDDDAALVSRKDVGGVWWNAVLRRTMLGTAKEESAPVQAEKEKQTRGRKPTRKGKEPAAAPSGAGTAVQPLFVSRQALAAATRTVVWGMAPPREQADQAEDYVSPFGLVILNEYEDRALARLRGSDEGYGVKNLEECLISWGEKSPKAFFVRIASFVNPNVPALLPSVSLLLAYLSRHSTRAYHALTTPLLANLITTCLVSNCGAIVTLAIKCLAIFVVTLPVIIGEHLFGIMAAYGRVVSWETPEVDELEGPNSIPSEDVHRYLDDYDDFPPDPVILFTVLYGIYPCNFTAFLKDAVGYLRGKNWKGPLADGDIGLSSVAIRDRSQPVIRLHTLHPALFTSDVDKELKDTKRWDRLEAADVMAECDRNVVQVQLDMSHDWRGMPTAGIPAPSEAGHGELEQPLKRSLLFEPGSLPTSPLRQEASALPPEPTTPLDSTAPTPKPASPSPASRAPSVPASRAVSKARSPSASATASPSTTRISTPHMPVTTHFANFQALQQHGGGGGGGLVSPASMSPLVRPRSASRFRGAGDHTGDPLAWSGVLEPASSSDAGHGPAAPPSSNMSRRSSGVGSLLSSAGHLLSPDLIPLGAGGLSASPLGRHGGLSPAAAAAAINAQLTKLETAIVVLQGEVNFQSYLKQLHLQHMGTMHRERVLESGAEAERQSSFRTIRTLRAQLRTTQSALDQLRSEQAATKSNWTAHIADLRDKLASLREQRMRWEHEEKALRAEVEDLKDLCAKKGRELEKEGAEFFDLKNQVQLDSTKLAKIGEYEHRIQALTKTLAICDADLVKFVDQRKEMGVLVGEWKKSELLREAVEEEGRRLKESLRTMETELAAFRRTSTSPTANGLAAQSTSKDELVRLRAELERLRSRNFELEEKLADALEEDDSEEEDEAENGRE
ncbi:hypothetical protein JCM10207_003790 [Rhodosporidiobolus poonsookiae]